MTRAERSSPEFCQAELHWIHFLFPFGILSLRRWSLVSPQAVQLPPAPQLRRAFLAVDIGRYVPYSKLFFGATNRPGGGAEDGQDGILDFSSCTPLVLPGYHTFLSWGILFNSHPAFIFFIKNSRWPTQLALHGDVALQLCKGRGSPGIQAARLLPRMGRREAHDPRAHAPHPAKTGASSPLPCFHNPLVTSSSLFSVV